MNFRVIFTCSWILLFLIVGCDMSETRIDYQPRTNLNYSALPDTIQKIYLDATKPRVVIENGDTGTINDRDERLVCLDSNIKKYSWETKFTSSFVDRITFKFNDKTLFMPFNGNSINPPYILYKKQFYFIITLNAFVSPNSVKLAKYGKFDLTDALK